VRRFVVVTLVLVAALGLGQVDLGAQATHTIPDDGDFNSVDESRTDVIGALRDSLNFLMMEHAARVAFQAKTRRELGGPFWGDYRRSVRLPGQWSDGDSWFTNNVAHPIQGATTGRIWLEHGPHRAAEFSRGRGYWASRGRAIVFSAVYSLQFEVGPFSEASIGNVGMRPHTTGWTDHVMTPLGGLAVLVAEDALDRHVIRWIERRTTNRLLRDAARVLFNPSRSLANLAMSRQPWYRAPRPTDQAGR
jgi:hypothetical protein